MCRKRDELRMRILYIKATWTFTQKRIYSLSEVADVLGA